MRKAASIILLILMLGLTACNSEGTETSTDNPTETSPPAEVAQIDTEEEETIPIEEETSSPPYISLPEEKPLEESTSYGEGMYKIGTDLPAGIYVFMRNNSLIGSVTIKDGSGSDANVIAVDAFDEISIMEVSEGQYLDVKGSVFLDISYTKVMSELMLEQVGYYPEGSMWLTGFHIPAGEYKLNESEGAVLSAATIYADATHTNPLDVIIVEGSAYVTLKDGEYIALKGASLTPIE